MTGKDVLRFQLDGSFNLIQARLEGLGDEEWNQRALLGTSKLGFILWHCARIVDWTVHSALTGRPEVADSTRWRDRFPRSALYGAGIPDSVADELADSTSRGDVVDYLGEVRAAATEWLGRQNDADLDARVPLKANQAARPDYLEPAVWAEVEDLDGLPAWQILARPAISHIRFHAGEFDVLLKVLRSQAAARPAG
ncbi:MAG TPA: DinB family protein [Candidatus Dormibacteraeota bacterium]|nr:DinB family protein [Candidatus Dormibacteraeota bacterium]